jgi:hypothetical protein
MNMHTSEITVANHWLALIDAGDFGTSWDIAATITRTNVPRFYWIYTLNSIRLPLGNFIRRSYCDACIIDNLIDTPPGRHLMLTFRSDFDFGPRYVEKVIVTKDTDGVFRVAGYRGVGYLPLD